MGSAWPPPATAPSVQPPEEGRASWRRACDLAALLSDPALRRAIGCAIVVGGGPVASVYVRHIQELAARSVTAPHDVSFASLVGGTDVEATLRTGAVRQAEGLLERARDGILTIRTPLNSGASLTELTRRMDAGDAPFLLVWHDDEDGVPYRLLDRAGAVLDLRHVGWSAIASTDPFAAQMDTGPCSSRATRVPSIDDVLIEALDHGARRMGAGSLHTTIALTRTAQALARCDDADTVTLAHALGALRLRFGSLDPRSEGPETPDQEPEEPETAEHSPPPGERPDENSETTHCNEQSRPTDDAPPPLDVILEAIATALPIALDDLDGTSPASAAATGKERSRSQAARGRPRGLAVRPPYDGARIDVASTLRAAAPWQRLRSRPAGSAIAVRKSDFRYVKRQATVGTTVLFVVDASGSAAVARLAEAKGAVELLLAQAYVRRDEVALIAFRDGVAQTLLPPTKGLVAAKRSLSTLPGGGATPLAAAMRAAHDLASRVKLGGRTPYLVFLTDGRGNVALDGRTGRSAAREDEERAARAIARAGLRPLVIDTSLRAGRHAFQFAEAVRGRLVPLPRADGESIARVVADAVAP